MSALIDFYQSEFDQRYPGDRADSAALRRAWWERFQAGGLPTTREENWKYTSLAGLERLRLGLPEAPPHSSEREALVQHSVLPEAHHQFVFVNGLYSADLSRHALPPSVRVGTEMKPEALYATSSLIALNQAFATDGFTLRIPSGLRLEHPIHVLMVSSKGEHTVCPRLHIHLEEGAEASVIEEYLGLHAESQWTQTVLSAQLDSRSTLHHIKVQTEGARTYHLADARFVLGEASTLNTLTLALGALVGREDLHIELQGSGAQARLDGLYIPRKRMHLDHHTEVFHQVPHCVSAQNYRGIVDDAGRAVFNGRVVVARDAQKTAAEQHNANLLLSDQAEIDTKPQLEIFADDVKCSHGATIGALNPQELFYLRSRGLDAVAARALVTYAFAARCLSGIKASPSLKAGLQNCILRALPGADDLTGLVE